MELELGLKITRTGEESTSTDLRIAKDRTGPVFFSTETEKMFILTVHLKGFKREKIKIEINDDGTRIAISGERPVREMVLVRWKMCQKETEIVGFRKVFRIPNGVRLDLIKARFDEEECILTISMPKSVKGIVGTRIEEIKEGEKSETTHDEQNTPQPESEQQQQQQPHPIKETLTPIRSAEIGVAHETEEIIPERIQESTGEEVVRESIEIDSKPPDPTFRSKETTPPPPPPPPPQEQELQEHGPNPANPLQTTVEQLRSEPEPDRAVERSEEQIEQEKRAEEEESSEGEASPRRARVEAALDEQNLRSEQESDESEEEEEEERGVESKRGGGFGGAYICAGSAALIGLLIVLVLKLLKKRKRISRHVDGR